MKNSHFFFLFLSLAILISNCKDSNSPTSSDKPLRTVKYIAFITPIAYGVSSTFTYTNENGGTSQSGANQSDGTFSKTIQLKSGTFVELKASGSTTRDISIGGRVIIYVDGKEITSSDASGKKYSNSVSVSITIP